MRFNLFDQYPHNFLEVPKLTPNILLIELISHIVSIPLLPPTVSSPHTL